MRNERNQVQEAIIAKKREAEELRNREEIEKFEKKFKPRQKRRDKYENFKQSEKEGGNKYRNAWILTIFIGFIAVIILYAITPDLDIFSMN